ncbi:hypothetical protein B0G83_10415 [Paraburkholderia sp. BL21I4N1]|nr:hypothetical protein B0G83_10415 [Paraburkholderia sp. BL21I4N1]
MDVQYLLKSRELAALQALEMMFQSEPETVAAIKKAVAAAGKHWDNEYLPGILGEDDAISVLTMPVHEDRRVTKGMRP